MKHLNRRGFLSTTGAFAAGAAILPNLMSCSRNGIVNLAIIGVGGRGTDNWNGLITDSIDPVSKKPIINPNVRIVAFCDVDDVVADRAYKAMPNVPRYKDFRVMLDEMHKDIDAVVVSTPDHTHFAATMAAMELGKHVYVEKPLAHNIWQLRTLKKAEKYYGVVSQLGNQGHASDGIRDIREWYEQGVIGEVKEVHAWFNGPKFDPNGWFARPQNYPPLGEKVPNTLDWDLWLGPVKERPYSKMYLPRFWRSYYDFGTGMLGDWGCHTLDAPYWSLELGFPDVIEATFAQPSPAPTEFIPNQSILRYEFPKRGNKPPVTFNWYEGGQKPVNRPEWGLNKIPGNGSIMVGDKHSILAGGKPWDRSLLLPKEELDAFNKKGWEKTYRRIPGVDRAQQHREFIDAIRGDGPMPGSRFEYGADLTEMALLGALSQRFNTRIEYDSVNMRIKNHPELNAFIKEEVRPGWSFGEKLWT